MFLTVILSILPWANAWHFGSGLNASRIFHSPTNKVPISLLYLQFYDNYRLDLNCSHLRYDVMELYQSLSWPHYGQSKLAFRMRDAIKALDMYSDKEVQGLTVQNLVDLSPEQFVYQCIALRLRKDPNLSAYDAKCDCVAKLGPEEACQFADVVNDVSFCLEPIADSVETKQYCRLMASYVLSWPTKQSALCSEASQIHIAPANFILTPVHLESGKTPQRISDEVTRQELKSYYMGLQAIYRLNIWADAHIFCEGDASFNWTSLDDVADLLPGYTPIMYFHIRTPYLKKAPIAVLSRRTFDKADETTAFAGNNLLLVIRNSRTRDEANLAAVNRMGKGSTLFHKGLVHVGYNLLAAQLFPDMDMMMEKHTQMIGQRSLQLTVVGEGDLGAGAAAILISWLSQKYPRVQLYQELVSYNLLVYDAPLVGNNEFVSSLKNVNVRNIVSKYDARAHLHCPVTRSCDFRHRVETGETTGETFDVYVPLPGRVEFDLTKYASNIDGIWSLSTHRSQINAHSVLCGTRCWLRNEICKDDPIDTCNFAASGCDAFVPDVGETVFWRSIPPSFL